MEDRWLKMRISKVRTSIEEMIIAFKLQREMMFVALVCLKEKEDIILDVAVERVLL